MDEMRLLWRSTDAVCFDVDSTVCQDEAIDELGSFLGFGEKVADLTKEAMNGSLSYKDSLANRLNIIQPSRQHITQFITKHTPQLTPGIRELMYVLQQKNIPIYLISGGFQSIIETVAEELHIPKQNIYANKLCFYYNGDYAGFDEKQPTCASNGKAKVIQQLKDKFGYKCLIHIGDGMTDLEAYPPADGFIGFGGNVVRDAVKSHPHCKWFVTSFRELIDELNRKRPKTEEST